MILLSQIKKTNRVTIAIHQSAAVVIDCLGSLALKQWLLSMQWGFPTATPQDGAKDYPICPLFSKAVNLYLG
jgi:hypothetical protein